MIYVDHGSTKGLAGRFLGNERMKIGGIYMMLAKENCGG
jgi:hypothetical protein